MAESAGPNTNEESGTTVGFDDNDIEKAINPVTNEESGTTVGIDGNDIEKAINQGDLSKIKKLVTPSRLAKNDHYKGLTNIVDKSLQVSFDLKEASHQKDIEEFQTLGDTVEDFACHLLEYSNKVLSDTFTDKEDFRDCIGKFTDKAISCEAKKFIAGPTVRECQGRLWYRTHHKMYTSYLWLNKSYVLVLVEAFLFPVIFLVLFIHHKLYERFRERLGPDDPIERLPDNVQSKLKDMGLEEQSPDFPQTIARAKQYCEDKQHYDIETIIDNCLKDPYESYKEHFVTPYFIFVRNILSLLTLLVLHVFVCAYPKGLEFSALEWVIMVFFVGRFLLEVDLKIKKPSFYKENQSPGPWKEKFVSCLSRLVPAGSDRWNFVMEIGTAIIYLAIFILRFAGISSNKCQLAASYMYGINAMFLTWRVFGQIMELKKSTGIKQIALRKILKDVIVIFIQLVGALVAFTFVFTAIYVADKSNDAKLTVTKIKGVCLTEEGFSCAFHFFEFLAWSIVGLADTHELLTLKDDVSKYFVKVLYLVFLMVAAVIIMNMLIALLSNTYQKVEDNAFHEWSYQRAVTIKKYSNCHPATVPFNIIPVIIEILYYCYKKIKCCRCQNEQNDIGEEAMRKKKNFCERLKEKYFAEHGDSFLQDRQVNENKHLMKNIANEVFREDVIKTSSSNEWKCSDGIKVDGRQLLSLKCTEKCKTLKSDCVHAALHVKSLSKEYPGFEVLIQHGGKRRYLGIGVASKDYSLEIFPGCDENSVGYRTDTGATFDRDDRVNGHKSYESMSFGGDLVRCLVLFDEQDGDDLPVQFTCNGREVGKAKLEARLIGNIHPMISMAYPGIQVIFRRINNVDSTKLQDIKNVIEQLQLDMAESKKLQQEILGYLKNSVHDDNHTEVASEGE